MRVPFETIKKYGQRVSPHSKFYIYDGSVYEPVYRSGKKCKNYKAVTETWKARDILRDAQRRQDIPKVEDICPGFIGVEIKNKKKKKPCRFDLLDL